MPRLYSDNAVLAKVKALYGKRLTAEDYRQLLQKKSVGEVASYLKLHPGYRAALGEVREDLIHRGQLEHLIRRRRTDLYLSLMRYLRGDDALMQVFLQQAEIEQLMTVLRLLGAGAIGQYVSQFPAYLSDHLEIDLFALAKIKDYDELLEALRHTPYFKLLGPFRPVGGNAIDLPGAEHALLDHAARRSAALIEAGYPRPVARELGELLSLQAELHNLSVIYRLKRYYPDQPDALSRLIVENKPRIGRGGYRPLLEAESHTAVLDRLDSLRPLRPLLAGKDPNLELVLRGYRNRLGRRRLRATTRPPVALFCYNMLLGIECDNLIRIIEGARYGLPAAQTERLLVY